MRNLLSAIGRFLAELRRRKVYQVALAYLVVGFMVIEAADLTLVRLGLPPWTVTFVVVLVGLGFPIALVLAWALEVTPEGVRVDTAEETSEEGPQTPAPATPTLWVGASVLALLLVGAWWLFGGVSVEETSKNIAGEAQEVEERSIAVLPFEALGQEEPGTFTEGIHDDLLTRLSNVGDLQVISRTSVQQYRNTQLSLPAIADSLGVRWVVEGGVQRAEDQVRINAQLIDPRSDAHRWAKSYERDLTAENVFAIQGEIAGEIAEALEATLTAGEQERIAGAPTQNLEAYRFYVEGRQRLVQATSQEGAVRAASQFGRALEQDSTYALAWAGLADAMEEGPLGRGVDPGSTPDSLSLPGVSQMEAARRALELDPDLAEGHTALGLAHYEQRNAPEALRSFQRALELKPSYAQAHSGLADVYQVLGRREKALEHLKLAEQLNPQHVSARHALFDAYNNVGQPEKSLEEAREQRRRNPYPAAIWGEARALHQLGRHEEAIQMAEERLRETDWNLERTVLRQHLVNFEAAAGDTARAKEHLEALRGISLPKDARPRFAYLYALAHLTLGDVGAAIEEFRGQSDWWKIPTSNLRQVPERFPAVGEDSRYQDLIREVNEYWGLNPDGSLPEDFEVPAMTAPETDA